MSTRSGRCRSRGRLAAAATTTAVVLAGGASPASAADCGAQGAVEPFVAHINAAHLERSPLQQARDIADIDDYALAHTVLVESMLAPALPTAAAVAEPFEAHVYAAHLERSPLQQARDLNGSGARKRAELPDTCTRSAPPPSRERRGGATRRAG